MESSDPKSSPIAAQDPFSLIINPEILVGLTVVPVLIGMVGIRAIAEGLQDLGALSEEIFRGDRLPALDFSDAQILESLSDTNSE